MEIYRGNLMISEENKYILEEVEKIEGYLSVGGGITANAPFLIEITSGLTLWNEAVLNAPKLKIIKKNLCLWIGAILNAPELKIIYEHSAVCNRAVLIATKLQENMGKFYIKKGGTVIAPELEKKIRSNRYIQEGTRIIAPKVKVETLLNNQKAT